MSIVHFNKIIKYWKHDKFLGHTDFKCVISRDNYQSIQAHLKPVPPSMSNDTNTVLLDLFWHSKKLFEHFQTNCVPVAVPTGCSVLDKNTVKAKARASAR